MKKSLIMLILMSGFMGCENREINEGEEFRPRAVNDNFDDTHFTKITVDGVEYLMTERDNNNPHEGFGFMAFRANKLIEKQDTIISYLRTMNHFQSKMYARFYNISEDSALNAFGLKFQEFLQKENNELKSLERETLINEEVSTGSQEEQVE